MVYLVLDPKAAPEMVRLAASAGCAVWVGSEAITPDEHKRLVHHGANVTRFSFPLAKAGSEVIAGALQMIERHHPGEIIWVQHLSSELTA